MLRILPGIVPRSIAFAAAGWLSLVGAELHGMQSQPASSPTEPESRDTTVHRALLDQYLSLIHI